MKIFLLTVQILALLSCRNEVEETTSIKNAITNSEEVEFIADPIEVQPYFKGGLSKLHKYLWAHIKYPSQLKRGEVEAKIFVSFIIDKDGKVTNAEVIKGSTNAELNKQISKVFNQMPNWVNEAKVNVKYTMPIPFDIE